MVQPFKRLSPIRSRLKKLLQKGWQRAVFRPPHAASPQEDVSSENTQTLEGPGAQTELDEQAFDALWIRMHQMAHEGLVKQVVVIDERKRLEIDARHGSLRQKTRDEQALQKMMGNKDRLFRPDRSGPLLRELGLLNADGSMSRRHARKYKQVHHFVELCQPVIKSLSQSKPDKEAIRILDLACGNSYLGLVLLEALHLQTTRAQLVGIDINPQWIDASSDRARALPHLDASFICARIEDCEQSPDPTIEAPDVVVALHACDTATDQALALALKKNTPAILCAPCCHAQVARQLSEKTVPTALGALIEHGHLRRSYGELLTDALRVAWIEAHGYEVAVIEFVSAEHSSKNLLIRGLKTKDPQPTAMQALREQCAAMGIKPALLFPKDLSES